MALSGTGLRTAAAAGRWLAEDRTIVAAILVRVDGSAPLDPGATMLVADGGEIEGSITGGCVEGAVAEEAIRILAGGPPRLLTYGISDELAGTVGLVCGGTVHVFAHRLSGESGEVAGAALAAAVERRPVVICTLLDGDDAGAKLAIVEGRVSGSLGAEELDRAVARDAAAMLAQGRSGLRHYGVDGATLGVERAVYVQSFAPPPRMLIVGAIDFSAAVARAAADLGYAVTICDPRQPFLRSARFSDHAKVEVGWPQDVIPTCPLGPRDAILVFTHDPKLDEPALRLALATEAGYVGALGSRRTTADRRRRLLESGVGEDDLARLHAPCGLDIGAGTAEEVAISVLAELIAVRSARPGGALRAGTGRIHAREGG